MSELRSIQQRKADVLSALAENRDVWLATASRAGLPHLIAVSSWWDGSDVVITTTAGSRTARNLDGTGVGRLALGSPEDVVVIDVRATESVGVQNADAALAGGFPEAVGWNPAEEGANWMFYRLQPVRVQAYRGYGELEGRDVMRRSRWLG
jgi:hypothetical protein